MNTAGSILKEARELKNKTIRQIAIQTRIKEKFLDAIEANSWSSLPDFPITQGFVNSFAQAVDANSKLVAALLRRDYPTKPNTKRQDEISLLKTSRWTPKTTIVAVSTMLLLILGIYLTRQYVLFAATPSLSIDKIEKKDGIIFVSGKTVATATVDVNQKGVLVGSDGKFETELQKQDLINSQVEVRATSRTGKTTIIRKQIGD